MKFEGFEILDGTKKILISAPHAVEQTREGKIKYAEPQTAVLAKKLNLLGYPAIIKTKNVGDDANYDLENPYKTELLKYCAAHNIMFLIDLHQLSYKREMDFCLGTGDETNRNLLTHKKLAQEIKNCAKQNNFSMTINDPFAAPSRTVSGFCSQNNLPSIQLEINSKLIAPYCNATQMEEVYDLIVKFIGLIEKEFKDENTLN